MFDGAEPFMQYGRGDYREMLFKEKVYAQRTKTDHNSSPCAFDSGELITFGISRVRAKLCRLCIIYSLGQEKSSLNKYIIRVPTLSLK